MVDAEGVDRAEDLNSDLVKIRQGITAFNNDIFPIKEIDERFDEEVEQKLAHLPSMTHGRASGGTNTFAGTIFALERLKKNLFTTSMNRLMNLKQGQ